MRTKLLSGLSLAILIAVGGCKSQKGKFEFVLPESGQRVAFGDQVKLKLNFPNTTLDSVVYSIDGELLVTKTDTGSVVFDTKKFGFGDRSLSAKVYVGGKEDIAYSNVIVLPPNAKNYSFEVVNEFPHDTKAYTQGLQYADGVLYETTGQPSQLEGVVTSLRKVDLKTGEVLKIEKPSDDFFGEGMTIVGNTIVFLTWENGKGFFYDKNTFKRIGEFPYENSKYGWGVTYDGNKLIKSDGSSRLYFLDAKTGKEIDSIEVYDENGKVDSINELEYIDGKVYANVYSKDIIVIIDPKTGVVEGRINLVGLYTEGRLPNDNELNGVAYDTVGKRLFVTGKLWPKLYEIKLIER
ncbi:glutaminyl-peptide cyclotransferase [Sphingobacterium bovistauri]|uniref:Glutaminyl-peptide cyclotransferase n=1 Tax=Sphingobacterium bovistauri TaxID=2781959 RepID=A0ABS7Z1S9_9SPHI|nr:glutaminyl-peptide cyclotransferase [Sphingobacterium bovistauri]MCA5004140.1 glutaminyl-peptide cyclotransferase [Sphingobacterium bovistauri]